MAQIVTITNPLTGQPAQVDQLEHTAQQIDDAIARALPGGAIDIASQNNDPRQWGLGTVGKRLYSSDDLNTIWKSGFYSWGGSNNPTNFIENAPSAFWVSAMEVISYGDGGVNIQRVWGLDTTSAPILVQRVKYGDAIRPWEYVNPPMILGIEYRTTERYLGKPVYVMAVDFGNLPNATTKEITVSGVSSPDKVVSVFGYTSDRKTLPTFSYAWSSISTLDDAIGLDAYAYPVNGLRIHVATQKNHSSATAVVVVKYTKSTD